MIDQLKYFDGELDSIEGIPDDLRDKYKTAFTIEYQYFIDAAAADRNGSTNHNRLISSSRSRHQDPLSHVPRRLA